MFIKNIIKMKRENETTMDEYKQSTLKYDTYIPTKNQQNLSPTKYIVKILLHVFPQPQICVQPYKSTCIY